MTSRPTGPSAAAAAGSLGFLRQLGAQHDNPPAECHDLLCQTVGLVPGIIGMHRHIPALAGEVERDGAPDAAGGTRHERHPGKGAG